MTETRRGFGLFAGIEVEVIRSAANAAEALGYDSFWVNHPGTTDGLAVLAQAAAVTRQLKLGVGVIPLTSRDSANIIAGVRQQNLPLDRLLLGIGSPNPGGLKRVRDGIRALRASLPVEIVIAALGPKMCRLAGEEADGVLFNWLTPEYARTSTEWVREGAAAAGRRPPATYAYVRVALGPAATGRLAREGARYQTIPSYSDHFDRMGVDPVTASVAANTPEQVQSALAQWDGVIDEVVVRAITAADTTEATLELLQAAAPSLTSEAPTI
jgi:alkanesulfonate monooxygenase SsuD/methylene tetrahydromethanopterin reductase-like flavin-dependent oxidoreductase (luciferase family)